MGLCAVHKRKVIKALAFAADPFYRVPIYSTCELCLAKAASLKRRGRVLRYARINLASVANRLMFIPADSGRDHARWISPPCRLGRGAAIGWLQLSERLLFPWTLCTFGGCVSSIDSFYLTLPCERSATRCKDDLRADCDSTTSHAAHGHQNDDERVGHCSNGRYATSALAYRRIRISAGLTDL